MKKLTFVAYVAVAASAILPAFAGSAEPDGTDFVVTADAGESYTLSTAIGNYTRLVKRGAGEVVLTAATTAFAGSVVVEKGTLSITDLKAVGTGTPVTVQSGAMKTRVPIENLRLEKKQPAQKQQKKVHTTVVRSEKGRGSGVRSGVNEVDIRGCTVDEGIMMVENFIAGSLLTGLETVTIIHGKGTGALRKGIHDHLRHMKQVKSKMEE